MTFPHDFDSLSKDSWWTAQYKTERTDSRGCRESVYYYPDDFRWPECPVSALTMSRAALSVNPVEAVRYLGEIRAVGGKAALFRQTRLDARMFDAALMLEATRASEAAARLEAVTKR